MANRPGRYQGNKPGSGPNGVCYCPKCSYTVKHGIGDPCFMKICPKCGVKLRRK